MEAPQLHPMATGHIPRYIVAADGSDYLFNVMIGFMLISVILIGVAYFSLHALPEKMAHGNNHPQFQLVGILALLALFTHNNVFWVAAIVIAGFQIPDIATPLRAISDAILKLVPEPERPGPGAPSENLSEAGADAGADAGPVIPQAGAESATVSTPAKEG